MSEPEKPKRTASGIALLVIGLLIFVPSGLCTGIMAGNAVFMTIDMLGRPDRTFSPWLLLQGIPSVLLIGAPFIIAGFFIIRAGLRRLRGG